MAPKLLTCKRRREVEEHGGDPDRMSSLPDSILCHILSFLPTKTCVATVSLVSRRWRHLWQHLQAFDFADDSDETVQGSKQFEKFSLFVNAVLAFRKSGDIRNFQLTCDLCTPDFNFQFRRDCAEMWIRAAINPNLEHLSLSILDSVLNYYREPEALVLLPHSVLNCTNLVSLSLVGSIQMKVQGFEVHFPSLKCLKLGEDIVDSESLFVLLSGCPILETLHHDYFRRSATWPKVPVPHSSKRLKFTDGPFSWTFLELDCSKYDDSVRKTTLGIIGNLQSMVEACIHFFPSLITKFVHDEFLDPILDRFPYSCDIQLHHSTSKCSLSPRILNCPEFCNLHHLKFILPSFNTNLLVNVLDKCHRIQVLIIQSNKEEQLPLRTWDPESTTVPKCLKFHLSYIHIEGFQGFEDELTFAEYILRNGLVLETMLIFVDTSMEQTNKYCSLKRLSDIPRSRMCQLKFDPPISHKCVFGVP